jgi:hypothetical protein
VRITIFKCKRDAPIAGHSDTPQIAFVAFHAVQVKAGNI